MVILEVLHTHSPVALLTHGIDLAAAAVHAADLPLLGLHHVVAQTIVTDLLITWPRDPASRGLLTSSGEAAGMPDTVSNVLLEQDHHQLSPELHTGQGATSFAVELPGILSCCV